MIDYYRYMIVHIISQLNIMNRKNCDIIIRCVCVRVCVLCKVPVGQVFQHRDDLFQVTTCWEFSPKPTHTLPIY